MTNIKFYGLKNCDTCKKALKTLETNNISVEFIDIRTEADLKTKVPAWLKTVGTDKLLNKRSTTWRNLNEEAQAKALTNETESTLITNPTLIKRPVIETDDVVYIGWSKDVQEKLQ